MNSDLIELICSLCVFLFLMSLGFFAGGFRERRHIRRLEEREQNTADMFVTQLKTFSNVNARGKAPQILFWGSCDIY